MSVYDVLGAAASGGGQAILIKVKNVPELVKTQGGALGAFAQSIAPETINAKVYSEMSKKLASGLKDQGVDADVSIVTSTSGYAPVKEDNTVKYVLMGLGVLAAGFVGYKVLGPKKVLPGGGR